MRITAIGRAYAVPTRATGAAITASEQFANRLDRLRPAAQWWLVFLVLFGAYLPTATYDKHVSVDTIMAALPAYTLARHGTLDLTSVADEYSYNQVAVGQTVVVDGAPYSNRNPGVFAAAVPAYLLDRLLRPSGGFTPVPATVTAALAVAAAGAILSLVLRRLARPSLAVMGALVMGFATTTWSISANALWSHGLLQLWLSLGMLAASAVADDASWVRAGFAYAAGVITRPYAAVVPAAVGLRESITRRTPRPAVLIGLSSLVGAALYLLYTRRVFHTWSVFGGYAEQGYHAERLSGDAGSPITDLVLAFVHPRRGLLIYSVWIAPLLLGLRAAWRAAPEWARSLGIASVSYLVLQTWAGGYEGGSFFFGNRFTIEVAWLAAPLLLLSWQEWATQRSARRLFVRAGVATAVGLQILGAVFEAKN